jgi:2-amino-4-hydroxy-6-hydroxymethyldihydropteridine diphosphokinase
MLAIGGNLPSEIGDPLVTLKRAVLTLSDVKSRVLKVSRFFKTPCFPAGAGPDFVNAALVVESALDAEGMLARLHEIEAEFGRTRETRWAGRTLDIDLIGGGDVVLPDAATYAHWRDLPLEEQMKAAPSQLILPHPRLQDRAFVLVPLNDVAPDWIHPVSGQSVAEMLNNLPESDRKAVVPL